MHLLIRRISPYTEANILLGVFDAAGQAAAAREAYAARYAQDPAADPWREQAYKEPGLSEADLVIEEIPSAAEGNAEVFVVSDYLDGFGQLLRRFDSIHGSADEAEVRKAELNSAEDVFVHYALCQRVRVGTLLSDSPEDQPRLHPGSRIGPDSP